MVDCSLAALRNHEYDALVGAFQSAFPNLKSASGLSKAILHAQSRFGIVPGEGISAARDNARAAFEAAIVLDVNQAILPERIDTRRTHECAILDATLALADFVVDLYVALGVDFEDVQPEICFDVGRHSVLVP